MTESVSIIKETALLEPLNKDQCEGLEEQAKAEAAPLIKKPNPEASPPQSRRRFSCDYKMKILDELDRSTIYGGKGAILRREGLYSSQVTDWRRQRDEGALSALNKARGRKKQQDVKDEKICDLEERLLLAESKLAQAEAIIDVQKKVSEIFGMNSLTPQKAGSK
jgi:transposase